jgi:hypothetical protein
MARMRRRARLGLKAFKVEISAYDVIEALIDRKILTEDEALDDARVAEALATIISRWTGAKPRKSDAVTKQFSTPCYEN